MHIVICFYFLFKGNKIFVKLMFFASITKNAFNLCVAERLWTSDDHPKTSCLTIDEGDSAKKACVKGNQIVHRHWRTAWENFDVKSKGFTETLSASHYQLNKVPPPPLQKFSFGINQKTVWFLQTKYLHAFGHYCEVF